jgi:hypothetical protein
MAYNITNLRKQLNDIMKTVVEQKKKAEFHVEFSIYKPEELHSTKIISKVWLRNRIIKKEILISRKAWGFDEHISYDKIITFDIFDKDYRPYFLEDELKHCLIFGEKNKIMRLLLPNSRIALLKLRD